MTASLGGLDVLVFTGGVGEHAAAIRQQCADRLGYLGVEIRDALNQEAVADVDLSPSASTTRTLLIRALEDLQIAQEVEHVLSDLR